MGGYMLGEFEDSKVVLAVDAVAEYRRKGLRRLGKIAAQIRTGMGPKYVWGRLRADVRNWENMSGHDHLHGKILPKSHLIYSQVPS